MAIVEEIVRDIQDELTENSLTLVRILEMMNEGASDLASGHYEHYGIPEICLPALEVFADITTSASESYVTMTTLARPFQKKLLSCSCPGTPITVVSSPAQIERYYPGLDSSGSISMVAASGDRLWYNAKNAETLKIQYFAEPEELTIGSTPDFLPPNMQRRLLRDYVLMNVPTKYRIGTQHDAAASFQVGVMQLFRAVGTYAIKPRFVHNFTGEYYEYIQ
jgi:hypothetical protein